MAWLYKLLTVIWHGGGKIVAHLTSSTAAYQIVAVNDAAASGQQVVIKSLRTDCTNVYKIAELVGNEQILAGLGHADLRSIIKLIAGIKFMPKYGVVQQDLSSTAGSIMFKLHNRGSNTTLINTAGEIFLDKELLYGLSHQDMCTIAYTAGYETAILERLPQSYCNNNLV